MSDNGNSKVQASVWLKPDQLDALRTAVYRCRPDYLQERDDTILTLMSDTGYQSAIGVLKGDTVDLSVTADA
jgi:hypothetical protein